MKSPIKEKRTLARLRRIDVSVLLRQPHGFEGFRLGLKELHASDLAVVHGPETGASGPEGRRAVKAARRTRASRPPSASRMIVHPIDMLGHDLAQQVYVDRLGQVTVTAGLDCLQLVTGHRIGRRGHDDDVLCCGIRL